MIYPIMSDEQQRQQQKGSRPFGLRRKSRPGSSKGSTVLPIRSSPFSCPDRDLAATRLTGIMRLTLMTRKIAPNLVRATAVGAPSARSPFVRLRELLADTPPGQSPISLAVGEPQHPIPAFVGPVIAAHVAEFGRYPINRGLDEFGEAVGKWLDRRYRLPRHVDPASEVLVLNGTREGLFLAGIAARNYVAPRAGKLGEKPAVLIPNPFYAAYAAGAIAADCEPVYLPATAATGFLPDLDALGEDLLARTVAFYLASPSNPQGAVAERAYLDKLTALARRFGFLILSDECYCESTATARRRECWKPRAPISTTSSCSIRCRSAPACPAYASALPPATANSWRAISNYVMSPRRRCQRRCNMRRSPPTVTKNMSRIIAASIARNSISPTRSSATVTIIGGRLADFSSGLTSRLTAAAKL